MNSNNSKKTGKAFIASAVGICLLLGGSTYALWSANAPMNSEATITAGDLRVSSMSTQNWFDVTKPASPVELLDLSNFYMVPGDKLQLDQDLNLIIVGDNISGKLTVELPNNTESASLLAQAKFTLKVFSPSGEELASVTPTINSNVVEAEVPNLPQTSPAGETYSIQVQVELPAGANNGTKLQASVLEDAIVTLEQGEKYAPLLVPNPQSDFTIALSEGKAAVTAYTGNRRDVVFPSEVEIDGETYPLKTIGAGVFKDRTDVDSVVIPEGVENLGVELFRNSSVQSVTIPSTVTHLGTYIFLHSGLTSFYMPDTVTSVTASLFERSENLETVRLSENLTTIPSWLLYNTKLKSVNIPHGTKTIGASAFAKTQLSEVTIPQGVTHIYGSAFANTNIGTVMLPHGIQLADSLSFRSTSTVYLEGDAPVTVNYDTFAPGATIYYHEGARVNHLAAWYNLVQY